MLFYGVLEKARRHGATHPPPMLQRSLSSPLQAIRENASHADRVRLRRQRAPPRETSNRKGAMLLTKTAIIRNVNRLKK
jgi:hypothetical protein